MGPLAQRLRLNEADARYQGRTGGRATCATAMPAVPAGTGLDPVSSRRPQSFLARLPAAAVGVLSPGESLTRRWRNVQMKARSVALMTLVLTIATRATS